MFTASMNFALGEEIDAGIEKLLSEMGHDVKLSEEAHVVNSAE